MIEKVTYNKASFSFLIVILLSLGDSVNDAKIKMVYENDCKKYTIFYCDIFVNIRIRKYTMKGVAATAITICLSMTSS